MNFGGNFYNRCYYIQLYCHHHCHISQYKCLYLIHIYFFLEDIHYLNCIYNYLNHQNKKNRIFHNNYFQCLFHLKNDILICNLHNYGYWNFLHHCISYINENKVCKYLYPNNILLGFFDINNYFRLLNKYYSDIHHSRHYYIQIYKVFQ